MCGRMTLTRRELSELADELAADAEPEAAPLYRARYNVAPTDLHPLCRLGEGGGRRLELARWGVRVGDRGGRLAINARAESAAFKDAFREAYVKRRCLVPADGFFEWRDGPEGRQPIWFHRPDRGLLLLAGLYEDDAAEPAPGRRRFTVLTVAPNAVVAEVHDRMPAILQPDEAAAWLVAPSARLLHPAADDLLVATPVSARVNSVKNDDPACLDPPDGARPPRRQLSLF